MTTSHPPVERSASDDGTAVIDAVEVDDDATPRRGKRLQRQLIEWGVLLGAALLIALLIKTFLFQSFYIPSESMYPTLKKDDRVLVNKLSYRLHDVNRGDIVVFKAPDGVASDDIEDFVKRVVGLPGETVEAHDGQVYIDGQLLEEPYLPDDVVSPDFGPVTVSNDHYWVLGDNRQNSKDSTYFGEIPGSDIIGRVFLKIWPPGSAGFM
ncbi:MAG: signal peptidase I [Acidimicrobiia bacterium]